MPRISFRNIASLWLWGRLLLLLGSVLFLANGCARKPESDEPKKDSEVKPDSRPGTVKLTPEMRQAIGLEVHSLATATTEPEVEGYGRVLDITGLVTLAGELVTAQAATRVSTAELARLRSLADQNNASQRTLQSAEAAAVKDQSQLESARLRLIASWGSFIAKRADLESFLEELGSLKAVLVQLEIRPGQLDTNTPISARLLSLVTGPNPMPVEILGPSPNVDPASQGRSFLGLVKPNAYGLRPGTALGVRFIMPGAPTKGVLVPRAAIIRFSGMSWVYRQEDESTFVRVPVALEHPLESGWLVVGRLTAGEKVVLTGAQELISEELKGQFEE